MADNILRLTVEDSEYNAKLKKAAEGIRHLAEVAHRGGGELTGLEKAELDYVKALGSMETKSRTAAGSVRELESTYKELKVIYDQLNDVEKADEGGKALAASLETLKQRTQEARAQLDAASQSLQTNATEGQEDSSVLSKLADKFVVNVDALKLFNWGLQAAEGALKVAKDAFFNNEEQLDEWGRMVESSDSLYKGFLNSLNTGDISGYLQNIGNIVQAARDAYDALDALGTFNAFNQRNLQKARTGLTESIASYREGSSSKEDVRAAGEALKKELGERRKREIKAYEKAIDELANQRGVKGSDLRKILSGDFGTYDELKNKPLTGTKTEYQAGILPGQSGSYKEVKVAADETERLADALRKINDVAELDAIQKIGLQADTTATDIANVDKQLSRLLNAKVPGVDGGKGGNKGGGGSVKADQTELQQNQAEINRLTQEYVRLGDMSTQSAEERKAAIQDEIEKLKERNGLLGKYAAQAEGRLMLTGSDINIQGLGNVGGAGVFDDAMKKAGEGIKITTPLQLDDKTIKKVQESLEKGIKSVNLTKEIGNISSGVGQVFGSLEQLGIELPDGLTEVVGGMQSVISLLTGITSIITAIEAIAGADAIIPFAGGGIIKAAGGTIVGSSYSGDNLRGIGPGGQLYGLNAGEVVLNRAESGIIASALDGAGGGFKNGTIVGVLEGEKIKLVLNRHYRRIGEGEIVTWKNG